MTPHEMPAVLEYLQASFARRLGDAEVAVWAEELAAVPQEAALAAVRRLRQTSERLPPLAAFRSAARMALPPAERDADRTTAPDAYDIDADGFARPVAETGDPALPGPPAPPEVRRAEIAAARRRLTAASSAALERQAARRVDRTRARDEVLGR